LATAYKILGQSEPGTTSNANLYTVPAATEAIVSSIVVCNTSGTDSAFRIFVRDSGATATTGNAVAFDAPLTANTQAAFTLGITLSATDVLTVRSSVGAALTFTAFGSELS
jgi:hypothetical protein